MQLIEISSLKLFCCKLVSHKMFCRKNFCHKNVARKGKKISRAKETRRRKEKKEGGARRVAMPRTSSLYEEVGSVATCRAATPYGRGCGGTDRLAALRACLRLQIGVGAEPFFGFFLLFFKTSFF